MKNNYLLIIASIYFLAIQCKNEPQKQNNIQINSNTSTKRLKTFLKDYYQSMSDRNWSEYKKFFWNQATLTTTWQKPGDSFTDVHITSIENFISQAHLGPGSKPIFEEKMISDPIILIEKNIATVWADYHVKFGTKDSLMEWSGKDVFTLMKHNDQWKIVSNVYE